MFLVRFKALLIMAAVFCSTQVLAQIPPFLSSDRSQSSPEWDWYSLENNYVEVIFPEGHERDAQKAARFIESFSEVSGENLHIKNPQSFPLILRPQLSLPNGYVSWMPRRSEWFIHEAMTPFIGGLDFFEALAIHEYRHINQFDFSYRSTNKIAYLLFGEFGLAFVNSVGIPNWFFEGDAVWAETAFTRAGRGRSPRFQARLKGLLLSGQFPTYDELMGGSYNTRLPNHYVYGYLIVSKAYEKFGKDIWYKILDDVSVLSINPYRIYNKFHEHTGVPFEQFVNETFRELKAEWEKRGHSLPLRRKYSGQYQELRFPMSDRGELYYLKRELNGYWALHKNGQDKEPLQELPTLPFMSKVDLSRGRLAYTQVLPHLRYGLMNFSDLFVYDLKEDTTKQITHGRRLYHPQWSPSGRYLGAVEKGKHERWRATFWDSESDSWTHQEFLNWVPLEVAFKDESQLYGLFQNKFGEKRIGLFDRRGRGALTFVTPSSRNNLFSLRTKAGQLFFEADYKGAVQAMSLKGRALYQCSREGIAAFTPLSHNGRLYYAGEGAQGQTLKSAKLSSCQRVSPKSVFQKGYLGGGPSDSIVKMGHAINLKKQAQKNLPKEKYSNLFGGASPNSWSFVGGRGYQLQASGRNYLNTFGYNVAVGVDASESTPFANATATYNKYWLPVSLLGAFEKRKTRVISGGPVIEWEEKEVGLMLSLPLQWVSGFYNHQLTLSGRGGLLQVGELTGAPVDLPNDETLNYYGGDFLYRVQKQKTYQQIFPSWGFNLKGFYRQVTSDRRESFDSNVSFLESAIFVPSLFENHGLRLRGSWEKQTVGLNNYRHSATASRINDYVFSRGFDYGYVDEYKKFSADYAMPLWNADWNLLDWHYLKRLYLVGFYDYTDFEISGLGGNLKSYGGELYFETTLLRRLPLTYGIRYSSREETDAVLDFFLAGNFIF